MGGALEGVCAAGMADAIVDLRETGRSLAENRLRVLAEMAACEALFVHDGDPDLDDLAVRIGAVLAARRHRYVMLHVDPARVGDLAALFPGLAAPTVLPLAGRDDLVAVHLVTEAGTFWTRLQDLRAARRHRHRRPAARRPGRLSRDGRRSVPPVRGYDARDDERPDGVDRREHGHGGARTARGHDQHEGARSRTRHTCPTNPRSPATATTARPARPVARVGDAERPQAVHLRDPRRAPAGRRRPRHGHPALGPARADRRARPLTPAPRPCPAGRSPCTDVRCTHAEPARGGDRWRSRWGRRRPATRTRGRWPTGRA